MFWNSINRKNKVGDTKEGDIEAVIAIHNNMNETTWKKVVEWERIANPSALMSDEKIGATGPAPPKLSRFIGRPMDLSPKARLKNIFGYPLPFDRHDWTIERPDGSEGRYVIDYYHDDTKNTDVNEALPKMEDVNAVKCIMVDVRPAVDSPTDAAMRLLYMPLAKALGKTDYEPLDFFPSKELRGQVGESQKTWEAIIANATTQVQPTPSPRKDLSADEIKETNIQLKEIGDSCKAAQSKIANCKSEEDCTKASMMLSMCMAKFVCPLQHKAVLDVLHKEDGGESNKIDLALENMVKCLGGFDERVLLAGKAGAGNGLAK
jgi:cytochrome c heme-lyase